MTDPADLDTEVLVVGAGPCGLVMAIELARRGVRCLVVDRKPSTAFNPQANATQARTMEHFRRLGLAERIRAQGLPGDHPTDVAYLTHFAGHELARLRLPTATQARALIRTMSGSWSAAELPHRVSQKYVEATLRAHADTLDAADIRFGWELRSFADTGEQVRATIAPLGAGPEQVQHVRAAYLLGADGARSAVRAQLDIGWEGATGLRRNFMGGRMYAVYLRAPDFHRLNPNDRAWMYVQVHPRMRAFLLTVDGVDEFAFHVQLPEGVDPDSLGPAQAQAFFAQASGLDIPVEILSTSTWLAGHALVARAFRRGRVFLGGDAAHLFTPTGGLGYNTAVEDAVNLAWKLHAVLRGQGGAALLDSYEAERQALARRNTGYARQFADSIGLFEAVPELDEDGPAGEQARAQAGAYLDGHARREFNIPGVTFGGRYDGSPVIVPDGSVPPADAANTYVPSACPGGRPPHAWLDDGRSLYDTFGLHWTLLRLGAAPVGVARFEQEARALGLQLDVVTQASPALRELYEAPLALIRPDHIVAWRGADDAHAAQVLRRACGRAA